MQQEEKTEFALRSTSTDMIMSPAKTGQIRRAIKVGTSGTSWAVVSVTRGLPGLTTITSNKIHCVARRPARSPGLEMPKPLRRAKCQLKTLVREGVRVHSRKEIGPADYRVVLTRYPDPSLGPGAWGTLILLTIPGRVMGQPASTDTVCEVRDSSRKHVEGEWMIRLHFNNFPYLPSGYPSMGLKGSARCRCVRQAYEVHMLPPMQSSTGHRSRSYTSTSYLSQSTRLLLECLSQAHISLALGHDMMQIWYSKPVGRESPTRLSWHRNH